MTRYVAFLRGVMPMNAKMPELKRSFEVAGFKDVKTVLSSGNVVFSAPPQSREALEKKAVAAMEKTLGRSFATIVRSQDELRAILASDPWSGFDVGPDAKRVVTFLRQPVALKVPLPVEREGARVLCTMGTEAFSAYLPGPKAPVFMTLIEKTLGKDVTTRTWDTVVKVSK